MIPILTLSHATRLRSEVVRSTMVGIGCSYKSTTVMMGESCRRRVEAEAIQAWRREQACSGGPRKVPVVVPVFVVVRDAIVEEVCLVVRWAVVVVGID